MKSLWSGSANRIVIGLLLIGYLMSQLVFLQSDPDISMATGSRGAWTDDGTLLCQVRNFLNGHGFELMESDGFLKAPLYSILQGIAMAIFGCEQLVARSTVLLLVVFALLLLGLEKSARIFLLSFILATCSLISIHQHAHLALSEMAAVSFVLVSGICLSRFIQDSDVKWFLGSQLLMVMAVGMKVQYLYLFMLPTLAWMVMMAVDWPNRAIMVRHSRVVSFSVFGSVVLFLAYYFVFKDEWYVFQKAQSGSLSLEAVSWAAFTKNCAAYLFRKKMIVFVILFFVSLVLFARVLFDKKRRGDLSIWTYFSGIWFFMELHKLPMEYLPIRYMVSFYISMGLFSSAVIADVWKAGLYPKIRSLSLLLLAVVSSINVYVLINAFNGRTYELKSVQERMRLTMNRDDVVVGPWAPSLTWGIGCRSYPVWNGFSGSIQIKKSGSPTVVMSEKGSLDSDFDWTGLLGRELEVVADSVTYSNIADWRVGVYWLRNK